MSRISAFKINGEVINCDTDSRPIKTTKRARARFFECNEKEVEKNFLSNHEIKQFNPKNCEAYELLKNAITPKGINWFNVRGFAELMSIVLNIQFPRESYRRLSTCMHWLNSHITEINDYVYHNEVVILLRNGKAGKITPLKDHRSKDEVCVDFVPLVDINDNDCFNIGFYDL